MILNFVLWLHLRFFRSRVQAATNLGRFSLLLSCAVVFSAESLCAATAQLKPDEPFNPNRVYFPDSVVPAAKVANGRKIVREILTSDELATAVVVSISLRMRDFGQLKARIQGGAVIARGELESKYLPSKSDYGMLRDWLISQGLTLLLDDTNHTVVFAKGTTAQMAEIFGVKFSRFDGGHGEFTAAVTAPSLPAFVSKNVLSIAGLQEKPFYPRVITPSPDGGLGSGPNGTLTPSDILSAYNSPTSLDGAGQTIAIIMFAEANPDDLTQFWTSCGVKQNLSNYSVVSVMGGAGTDQGAINEATQDVAWASSMAPAAKVVIYAGPSFIGSAVKLLNDLPLNPSIHQVSMSLGLAENSEESPAVLEGFSQTWAQLVASGVTVFASTGDSGSNPDPTVETIAYNPSFPLSAEYPADDPFVTAVGGTSLSLGANSSRAGETSWSSATDIPSAGTVASGGGISTIFSRPSWQVGAGVPAGSMRCVPDVAAVADSVFAVFGGKAVSSWGTSLSAPIWAGTCALINQALAAHGKGPVGLLGPQIYPLLGSSSFYDVTSGNNGAYAATPGYDLCTGLGSPNISSLVNAMLSSPIQLPYPVQIPPSPTPAPAPEILNLMVAAGNPFTVSVEAPSATATYSWVLETPSGSYPLSDGPNATLLGAMVSGSATASLTISGATSEISGDQFHCFVFSSPGEFDFASIYTLVTVVDALSDFEGVEATAQAPSSMLSAGSSVTLSVSSQPGFAYQWQLEGVNIPSAVTASYSPGALSNGPYSTAAAGAADAGRYTVEVTDPSGQIGFLDLGELRVGQDAWLINLSARADIDAGDDVLIGGFVTTGPDRKSVLLRAGGPSLSLPPFSISTALALPHLAVYSGSNLLRFADAWNSSLAGTMVAVGAYPWAIGSADSALLESVDTGGFTGIESGANGSTGIGLLEVYDADAGAPVDRLINLSARAHVGAGSDALIGGFVILGKSSLSVLIRAGGPSLALPPANLTGILISPTITLYDRNGDSIATSAGWSNPVELGTSPLLANTGSHVGLRVATGLDFQRCGAYSYAPDSADCALVATLPPGSYTVVVSGIGNATGVALFEIYEEQ